MKRTVLLLGAALIWLAPVPATELTSIVQAATAVSGEEFVTTAGVAGMFEIESSKIAAQKSMNGDVKTFAERMVSDHTKAAEELKTTASSAGEKYVMPTALDDKHQKMMDELKSADQSRFDAAYVRMQTDAHKEAVELFDGYAKQGDNPNLKTFAEKTLPTLQQHYDMIKQIGASKSLAQATQPSTGDATTTQAQTTTTQPSTGDASTTEAQTTTQPSTGSSGLTVSGLEPGNVMMASNLIGSTVYNAANENVGDVNDIILSKDGKVQAVIIGVGGFLGLGEKDVAVPMSMIQFVKDENNNMKYTISASRQDLEQAPAFDRTRLTPGGSTSGQ